MLSATENNWFFQAQLLFTRRVVKSLHLLSLTNLEQETCLINFTHNPAVILLHCPFPQDELFVGYCVVHSNQLFSRLLPKKTKNDFIVDVKHRTTLSSSFIYKTKHNTKRDAIKSNLERIPHMCTRNHKKLLPLNCNKNNKKLMSTR